MVLNLIFITSLIVVTNFIAPSEGRQLEKLKVNQQGNGNLGSGKANEGKMEYSNTKELGEMKDSPPIPQLPLPPLIPQLPLPPIPQLPLPPPFPQLPLPLPFPKFPLPPPFQIPTGIPPLPTSPMLPPIPILTPPA
uniref:Uncharacterized protein n=1 Tax=Fagus sylvatica TaxID=28930 RepID=A0A2N9GZJ0_FAGSY